MKTAVTFHGLGEGNKLAGRSPASTWTRLVHLPMPKQRHRQGVRRRHDRLIGVDQCRRRGQGPRRYVAPDMLVYVRGIHRQANDPERFEARTVYLHAPTPGDNQGGPGQRVDRTERLEPSSIDDFEVRIEVESIEPNSDDGPIDLVVEFAVH